MLFHNLKTNLMKGILIMHNRFCEWGRFEVTMSQFGSQHPNKSSTISQPTFFIKKPK